MSTPTSEQIAAYLTSRGWKSPAETSSGRWTSPSGRASRRDLVMEDDFDYHLLLRSIAAHEGRSTLAIGLEIDGHAVPNDPDTDLTAIGAVIALWRLSQEHPDSFQRLTQNLGIGLETTDPAERDQLLVQMQSQLENVRYLIGDAHALPARIPAADRRPRREVWAADTETSARINQWPKALHAPLLDTIVNAETRQLNLLLDSDLVTSAEDLTTWKWDPEQAAAIHSSGNLRHQPAPHIDEALTEVRYDLVASYDHAEARAVATWVDKELGHLRKQGWAAHRQATPHVKDIRFRLDRAERTLTVITPSMPGTYLDGEREMYLRLTAELAELAASDPAAQAFPAAVSAEAGSEADEPSTLAAPEGAEEAGPVR